ncbi:MAG: RuBisCO large subunit C-terminal-like domain-containing protein [Balneolaceae bacterium]|nr:RuBisCO large subunit C-terminal-like domain-containing protein [Balneolaceae bacterium]
MDTFNIYYRLSLTGGENIDRKVEKLCREQSVEMPLGVVPEAIKKKVVGQPVSIDQIAGDTYDLSVQWPLENLGGDISTFLNVLYGNISMQPGIRITGLEWKKLKGTLFHGPAFGIEAIRDIYGIRDRALSSTALKPLGSSAERFGQMCYEFALGGIDVIKDDHGLTDQSYAPFEERVRACVKAVGKAADETGRRSYYYPHITALAGEAVRRYEKAAELGADGVIICPHIAGLETMHLLAGMDVELPIIAHPSFSGALTTHNRQGLSPDFLYGAFWRALGADYVIYPNVEGRFIFSEEQCLAINEAARTAEIPFKKSFPMPGGGLQLSDVDKWIETYGKDTAFLMGGSLYEHPEGITVGARELMRKITEIG